MSALYNDTESDSYVSEISRRSSTSEKSSTTATNRQVYE